MNENGFNNTRATIKDVAVKANVSLSTVSRALREPDKTPAETVSKVRAAAEALNYVYNATAGSLSKRRSDTIGILLPSPTYAAFGVNCGDPENVLGAELFVPRWPCRSSLRRRSASPSGVSTSSASAGSSSSGWT